MNVPSPPAPLPKERGVVKQLLNGGGLLQFAFVFGEM